MGKETEKAAVEMKVFTEFAKVAKIGLVPGSAKNGNADLGEPDIFCTLLKEGNTYFELTEACAPEFKALINKSIKSGDPEVTSGSDVSVETLEKKLRKKYKVSEPVELLLYTNNGTVLTDKDIAEKVAPILSSGLGPFRRVWLLGEGAQVLASNS